MGFLKDVITCPKSHLATWQQNWDFNPGLWDADSCLLLSALPSLPAFRDILSYGLPRASGGALSVSRDGWEPEQQPLVVPQSASESGFSDSSRKRPDVLSPETFNPFLPGVEEPSCH